MIEKLFGFGGEDEDEGSATPETPEGSGGEDKETISPKTPEGSGAEDKETTSPKTPEGSGAEDKETISPKTPKGSGGVRTLGAVDDEDKKDKGSGTGKVDSKRQSDFPIF